MSGTSTLAYSDRARGKKPSMTSPLGALSGRRIVARQSCEATRIRGQTVQSSGAADCFLHKLHSRRAPQFEVNMGEMGLDGAVRHQQTSGDVLVRQPGSDETNDLDLGRRQRFPTDARPFCFPLPRSR